MLLHTLIYKLIAWDTFGRSSGLLLLEEVGLLLTHVLIQVEAFGARIIVVRVL